MNKEIAVDATSTSRIIRNVVVDYSPYFKAEARRLVREWATKRKEVSHDN